MTINDANFIISEFETAWNHMGKLDDRRFQILQYYAAYIGVVIFATFSVINFEIGIVYQRYLMIFIYGATSLLSLSCVKMLESERKATERYRNKINAIRCYFYQRQYDEFKVWLDNSNEFRNLRGSMFRTESNKTKNLDISNVFKSEKEQCTAFWIGLFIKLSGIVSLVITLYLLFSFYFF